MDMTIHIRSVSCNSPRHRVAKRNGLWHVWRYGEWFGATSYWDRAIDWAVTGRIVLDQGGDTR